MEKHAERHGRLYTVAVVEEGDSYKAIPISFVSERRLKFPDDRDISDELEGFGTYAGKTHLRVTGESTGSYEDFLNQVNTGAMEIKPKAVTLRKLELLLAGESYTVYYIIGRE